MFNELPNALHKSSYSLETTSAFNT